MSHDNYQPKDWDFMFDPPSGHKDECNCERCHKFHVENGDVYDNSHGPDYQCCQDELEAWIHEGKWCKKHGNAFIEKGRCDQCEHVALGNKDEELLT